MSNNYKLLKISYKRVANLSDEVARLLSDLAEDGKLNISNLGGADNVEDILSYAVWDSYSEESHKKAMGIIKKLDKDKDYEIAGGY